MTPDSKDARVALHLMDSLAESLDVSRAEIFEALSGYYVKDALRVHFAARRKLNKTMRKP